MPKKMTLFLLLISLGLYFLEFKLLLGSSLYEQVIDYLPDELLFYQAATHYHLYQGMIYGYGVVFWGIAAILVKCLPFSFTANLIILRATFLAFKYAAFVVMALAVKQLRGNFVAGAFYCVLLLTPGYYFYGKVFSAEYLLLFLVTLSVYLLAIDEGRLSNKFYFALAAMITAIATKVYVIPLGLLFIAYIVKYWRKEDSRAVIFRSLITVVVALLLNGLPLLSKSGWEATMAAFQSTGRYTLDSTILYEWFYMNTRTWEQIPMGGIEVDFSSLRICTYLFIPFFFLQKYWNKLSGVKIQHNQFLSGSLLCVGLLMAAIVCFQNMILYWYLFPAYMMILTGLFGFFSNTFSIVLAMLVIVAVTPQRIYWRIQDRAEYNEQLKVNYMASNDISHLILKQYPQGGLVFTDANIAYKPIYPLQVLYLRESIESPRIEEVKFIIINGNLRTSQLLFMVFHGAMPNQYKFIGSIDKLYIYARDH